MKNLSNRYLFNIEEEASNPAGAGRATNKEFIIASVYSQETRKGQVDLNQVIYTDMRPSRKLIDMFLCTDGLPVSMSDKFQGYKNRGRISESGFPFDFLCRFICYEPDS